MKLIEAQNPEVSESKSTPQLPVTGVGELPLLFTAVLGFPFAILRVLGGCSQTMHSLSPSHLLWL